MKRNSAVLGMTFVLSCLISQVQIALAQAGQAQGQAQQTIATATDKVVPPLVNFSGVLTEANGKPLTGAVNVTFSLYKEQNGGAAVWMETQAVQPDAVGHYSVMLGATSSSGLPSSIFSTGEAHWLGVQVQGEEEQPRVLLVSAPYALKAGDAETIGGLPPSAFMMAPTANGGTTASNTVVAPTANNSPVPPPSSVTGSGTKDYVPLWTSSSALGNSVIYQSGSGSTAKVGVNNTAPTLTFDVKGQGRFVVSTSTNALLGNQNGTGSAGNGVVGLTSATAGYGVYGFANATTGTALGVYGTTASSSGTGVYGSGGVGVEGTALFCCNYAAIFNGYTAPLNSGNTGGPGVIIYGGAGDQNAIGTSGGTALVTYGGAATNNYSESVGGNGIDATGGVGTQYYADGVGGVFTGANQAAFGDGVDAFGGSGSGVVAYAGDGVPENGIYGPDGIDAFYNSKTEAQSYAGYFTGDVNVTGTMSAAVKSFKIDHPLDPQNKYLVHASIESSEMVNIYSGNVTTDAEGNATVQMPKWFGALNTDFRYQLTPIGQFAQAIIASEISNNQFTIRTDKPNVKVSWQVTGVRQDAYAKAHPLLVEQAKEAGLKGHYLNPEAFGAAPEQGIGWVRQPMAMKRMQEHRAKAKMHVTAPPLPPQTVAQVKK
jgi:trimeric autotransporter adhesin